MKNQILLKHFALYIFLCPYCISNLYADDEFDPFLPDETDPGNADISNYIFILFIVGLVFAFVKFKRDKKLIE